MDNATIETVFAPLHQALAAVDAQRDAEWQRSRDESLPAHDCCTAVTRACALGNAATAFRAAIAKAETEARIAASNAEFAAREARLAASSPETPPWMA